MMKIKSGHQDAPGPRWSYYLRPSQFVPRKCIKVNIKSGGTRRGLAGSLRPLGRATEIKFTNAAAGEAHLHELRSTKTTAKIPVRRVNSILRSSMEDQCSGFNLAIFKLGHC